MHVTDAAAFNRMAKRMLNGDAVPWRMTGESTVWSMGIPFPLSIDKETTFPPIQLTNYATSNLEMSHGNTTTNQLVIDADVSFYSASPMRLEGFGLLKAELYYDVSGNNPDLSPAERLKLAGPPLRAGHVKMGECHMYDYTVVQGMNTIKTRIYLDANYATGQSLGRWASEFDQTIVSVGPTNISPFIDGIWEGANDMPGSSITLYTATFVTADTLVKGYNPKTGEPCKVWDGSTDSCDRGSTIMGMNPFNREWFIKTFCSSGATVSDTDIWPAIDSFNVYSSLALLATLPIVFDRVTNSKPIIVRSVQHRIVGESKESPGVQDVSAVQSFVFQCFFKGTRLNASEFDLKTPPAIQLEKGDMWVFDEREEALNYLVESTQA